MVVFQLDDSKYLQKKNCCFTKYPLKNTSLASEISAVSVCTNLIDRFALLIVHCLLAEWNYDPWFSLVYVWGSNSSHLYQDKTFTPTWNTFWWIVVLLLFLGNRSPVMSSGDVVSKITKQFTIVKWFQPIFFTYIRKALASHNQTLSDFAPWFHEVDFLLGIHLVGRLGNTNLERLMMWKWSFW